MQVLLSEKLTLIGVESAMVSICSPTQQRKIAHTKGQTRTKTGHPVEERWIYDEEGETGELQQI